MESQPHERRQFGRLNLLAYGQGKTCTLEFGGTRCQAELIDISAGGARLKWQGTQGDPAVKQVVFSLCGGSDGGQLQGLASVIRWRHGQELGIQFVHELEVPVSTLQKMVS